MGLLIGTRGGIYRPTTPDIGSVERVLDCGRALRVEAFDGVPGAFAATKTGLYRSTDGGTTWTSMDVPRDEVYSVAASPEGDLLYAGTHPAHVYRSDDGGDTWYELDGFRDLSSTDEWHTPRHRNEAHVRSLVTHRAAPNRVVAGVEVGGVHVSDDRGDAWEERRIGLHDDVHHVLAVGPEEYVASCGGGLYITQDAGRSWARLDGGLDAHYFREAHRCRGALYAAAAGSPPNGWDGEDGAAAALYVSQNSGDDFEEQAYPGEPQEVVLAWATTDRGDRVVAGTNAGRLIACGDGGWEQIGILPAEIGALCEI